jgi:hypothetical protein
MCAAYSLKLRIKQSSQQKPQARGAPHTTEVSNVVSGNGLQTAVESASRTPAYNAMGSTPHMSRCNMLHQAIVALCLIFGSNIQVYPPIQRLYLPP